jgi:hypothetical protein
MLPVANLRRHGVSALRIRCLDRGEDFFGLHR